MSLYRTIYQSAQVEDTIQRSRFITHVIPIDSFEEGKEFVALIKEEYKDATHNVPAVVFGNKQEIQWMSDDGEPQGTAGPPILRLLVEEGLTNVAVVVTRYFGGIKLGTGGLVRAYSGSAKHGLEEAGICEVDDGIVFDMTIDYTYLARLQNYAENGLFSLESIDYAENVTLHVSCEKSREEEIIGLFRDVTNGSCVMSNKKNEKIKRKIC